MSRRWSLPGLLWRIASGVTHEERPQNQLRVSAERLSWQRSRLGQEGGMQVAELG